MALNPTLDNPSFLGHQDFSWWLGTVVNADDREAKLGRVKVEILGFHEPKTPAANLPWCMVLQPTTNAAVSGVGNSANNLKSGSFVMGFFLDYPDCQQPVVMGTLFSEIQKIYEPGTQQNIDTMNSGLTTEPGGGNDATKSQQPAAAAEANDELGATSPVSTSTAAASLPSSRTNPSGQVLPKTVANGKDSVANTVAKEIQSCIEDLGNIFKTAKIYDPNNTALTQDLDKESQFIPVSKSTSFPPRGKVKIGSEVVGYNGRNSFGLTLSKRGMEKSKSQEHKKGTKVEFLKKTTSAKEVVGTFSDTAVDVQAAMQHCFKIIKNLIWYIVNQLKAFLMEQVTKVLNAIGLASVSPIPLFVKGVTEIILQVLRMIGCSLDGALVDAIMGGIEGFIESFIDQILNNLASLAEDFIAFAENCINQIFGSIFQLVEVANQILSVIDSISDIIDTIGSIESLTNLTDLASIGNVVGFILQLLGIGCNRDTDGPININWETCAISANNCSPFNFSITSSIPGRWSPEYSKMFVQSSESGHLFVQDDTPGSSRMILEHGPSKSGTHIYDNGDVRVTNNGDQTEITVKNKNVVIKGNANLEVEGDYHLKVGGNYHLEVRGQMNMFAIRESKFTFSGEHKTIYKNDSELSAHNGLAIAGSKVGISASGQFDAIAPTITNLCTEHNTVATGSVNIFSTFYNKFCLLNSLGLNGLSDVKFNLGTTSRAALGTDTDFVAGVQSKIKVAAEQNVTVGSDTRVKVGAASETEVGTKAENNISAKLRNGLGLSMKNVLGADFQNSIGLFSKITPVINLDVAGAIKLTC
jgi:hypothetical protein